MFLGPYKNIVDPGVHVTPWKIGKKYEHARTKQQFRDAYSNATETVALYLTKLNECRTNEQNINN